MWAASTLIPSLRPCHCPPNFFSTTAKPSQADLPAAAVSAKFRGRRQRHKNHDEYGDEYGDDGGGGGGEEEIGGLGQAVVSALKSDPLPKSRAGAAAAAAAIISSSSSSSSSDHHHRRKLLKQQQRKGEADEQNTQLSGSDVLWALQRVAHKNKYHNHNHNTNKTSGTSSSSTVSKGNSNTLRRQEEVEEDTTDIDYYCNSSNAAAAATATTTTTTMPPFCIKSEWTSRLDELDKRLHHLLDT